MLKAVYSELSNKQAGWNKQVGLNLLSVLIKEQDGINREGGYS